MSSPHDLFLLLTFDTSTGQGVVTADSVSHEVSVARHRAAQLVAEHLNAPTFGVSLQPVTVLDPFNAPSPADDPAYQRYLKEFPLGDPRD